jgi:hypothetical protein
MLIARDKAFIFCVQGSKLSVQVLTKVDKKEEYTFEPIVKKIRL